MSWIRIRGHHGTGLMTIATTAGTVERAVDDGVVDWPAEVAMPAGSTAAEPPETVRAREQARRRAEVAALAASLGLTVTDPDAADTPKAEAAPEEAAGPEEAPDAPPVDEKKAPRRAKPKA